MTKLALSKILRLNEKHDCGALTAFRIAENCGLGEIITKKTKHET